MYICGQNFRNCFVRKLELGVSGREAQGDVLRCENPSVTTAHEKSKKKKKPKTKKHVLMACVRLIVD